MMGEVVKAERYIGDVLPGGEATDKMGRTIASTPHLLGPDCPQTIKHFFWPLPQVQVVSEEGTWIRKDGVESIGRTVLPKMVKLDNSLSHPDLNASTCYRGGASSDIKRSFSPDYTEAAPGLQQLSAGSVGVLEAAEENRAITE